MNRRGFFKVFAALPLVGVGALAKSVRPTTEPDITLEGNVLIRGALRVEGVETGTALAAGDDWLKDPYAGIWCQGKKR